MPSVALGNLLATRQCCCQVVVCMCSAGAPPLACAETLADQCSSFTSAMPWGIRPSWNNLFIGLVCTASLDSRIWLPPFRCNVWSTYGVRIICGFREALYICSTILLVLLPGVPPATEHGGLWRCNCQTYTSVLQ